MNDTVSSSLKVKSNSKVAALIVIPVLLVVLLLIIINRAHASEGVELIDVVIEYLPIGMFATLAILLFTGFPVAFVLGGVALFYGFLGICFGIFAPIEFFNFVPRIWGQAAENLILVAVPTSRSSTVRPILPTVSPMFRTSMCGMTTVFPATMSIRSSANLVAAMVKAISSGFLSGCKMVMVLTFSSVASVLAS